MKRNLMIASMAAVALSAFADAPYTPPFSESFNSGLGEFTTYDANADGNTFKYNSNYGGYGYTNCVYYVGNSDNGADEWLFSPKVSFKAGCTYEMTYYYKASTSNTTNHVEWKAGLEPSASAMTISIGDGRDYSSDYSFTKDTLTISVEADGDYNIGLHLTAESAQGYVYIDQFEIAAGVDARMPEAPTLSLSGYSVNAESNSLEAMLQIVAPANNISGESLSGPLTMKISRSDKDDVVTLSDLTPGETVTYTDPAASMSRVSYTAYAVSNDIEGKMATVVATPNIATPKAVEGFTVTKSDNIFLLSWNAVTEAATEDDDAIFIPSEVRYTVSCNGSALAEKIEQTEYSYDCSDIEGQKNLVFSVVAYHGSKQSEAVSSDQFFVGDPLEGEFAESFASYSYTNSGWTVENDVTSAWQPSTGNYYPTINPQDGDNGCLSFAYTAGQDLRIYSPVLDLSKLTNPVLKFWVYIQPSSYAATSIQPGVSTVGVETMLDDAITITSGSEEGWAEFSYSLPETVKSGNTQLFFVGHGDGTWSKIYMDNISIRSYLDHNLAVAVPAVAKSLEIGEQTAVEVVVENKGTNAETDYSLTIYADEEAVATVEGVEIQPFATANFELPFTAFPKYADKEVAFRVVLNMDADLNADDNEASFTIPVLTNDLGNVTDLTAVSSAESVALSWTATEVSTDPVYTETVESFEGWENGTTEAINDWVFIDVDGVGQYGLNSLNNNTHFAAMVIENYEGPYSWSLNLESYDGEKCLAVTPAYSWSDESDNWIVTPVLKGGSEISFYAKTFYDYSRSNDLEMYWSEGGTEISDFTLLETKTVTNSAWSECRYTLPANAKRFAIHIGDVDGDAVLFDKFSFTAMQEPAVLSGYNVYRDDQLISSAQTACEFVDTECSEGEEHYYNVTTVYDKGESGYSDTVAGTRGNANGVAEILIDGASIEYYNLQGIRISGVPEQGEIVIMRQGNRSKLIRK